ncbi:MAG TPA: NAD(P)/FAD-dependent oxidoreductase [Bryobacteraceae bacterium]|nr:NAD(P)/FAD-dependent oxidoreductase [Bryobacteraceae bacterium]
MASAGGTRQVCIVGGGPAGLAAAIALRLEGFPVTVADSAQPPVDKACGEGLMPDSVEALESLGVKIPKGTGYPVRGVAFINGQAMLTGDFSKNTARGLRRTALHELLVRRASDLGVQLLWNARGVRIDQDGLLVNGSRLTATVVVGADGQNSRVRRDGGLSAVRHAQRRYGFRRHYRIAPWSDYVQLYWGRDCQVYVTPIAENEVGVALISGSPHFRLDQALGEFPNLQRRLEAAERSSREMGSVTGSRVLRRVSRPGMALVGDASGTVDAITGEGMRISFQQAIALAKACKAGDLFQYELAHRELRQRPNIMAAVMLLLARHDGFRRRAFSSLSERPEMFQRLLAVHIGESGFRKLLSWRLLPLGVTFLTA